MAAKAMGVSNFSMFKHLLPNILGPIAVYTTLTIPQVMLWGTWFLRSRHSATNEQLGHLN